MAHDPTPSDDSADDANAEGSADATPKKNALEWAVTGVGAVIVLFVVGFFVYELVAGASGPADLSVTLGEPAADSLTVEVPVEVENAGQEVAENVVVRVCAGPESCAEVMFDYVPYQSSAAGTVGLEAPLAAPPTGRVVSYRDP
ncbi:hypothetical protein [Rubrivirga sp. IMCC45206]|uniref:hypothetical protein n=1 Tax=Rubrivirga sp. IMCC45206 TaxID=3391614 RepID=UPI00398FF668